MKKISFLMLAILFNFTVASCTDEGLDEILQITENLSATTDGNEKKDPNEIPPEDED